MRGIPGAGKNFTSETLTTPDNIFSADDYFMKDGEYRFDMNKLGEAHGWNNTRIEDAMIAENPIVVVNNTNIREKDFNYYLNLAIDHGYDAKFVLPTSPWFREIYPRILDKSFTDDDVDVFFNKNVHGVPKDTIRRMMTLWSHVDEDKYKHDA